MRICLFPVLMLLLRAVNELRTHSLVQYGVQEDIFEGEILQASRQCK